MKVGSLYATSPAQKQTPAALQKVNGIAIIERPLAMIIK